MSEPKFTPAPWMLRADSGPSGFPPYSEVGTRDSTIARLACSEQHEHEFDANAHLISAAPELYAALTAVSDMLYARPDMVAALRPMMGPAEHAVFDAAHAALAKARGDAS